MYLGSNINVSVTIPTSTCSILGRSQSLYQKLCKSDIWGRKVVRKRNSFDTILVSRIPSYCIHNKKYHCGRQNVKYCMRVMDTSYKFLYFCKQLEHWIPCYNGLIFLKMVYHDIWCIIWTIEHSTEKSNSKLSRALNWRFLFDNKS